mgnify:CR=1 FL=1
MKTNYSIILLIILSLFIASCNFFTNGDSDGRIIIDNNDNSFTGRIITTDEEIELDSLGGILGKTSMATVAQDFRLILRAEVNPPVFEGFTLRASHVTINEGMAYVSYNREGEDYLGGVEIFDVSDIENPVLVSQAIFTDTDISSVAYSNKKLYLAGAINPYLNEVKSPAIIECLKLNFQGKLTNNTDQYDVSSYVSTDVFVYNNFVLATTGSDGDLLFFEENGMDSLGSYPVNNARSVSMTDDHFVFLSASPANLYVINSSNPSVINTYPIAGETIPESKSTLVIDGNYGYVALNDAGLKIIDLSNGNIVQEIPRPQTPENRDDVDYVTNGVSINEDLVFIANGAAGVFVGQKYDGNEVEIYGSYEFNSSTNFVESNDDIVFVATGFGGFKILEIQRNNFGGSELISKSGSAGFKSKYAAARFKSFSNTNRKEVYVGVHDIARNNNRSEADFNWTVPGEYNILFSYDADTHELTASISGNERNIDYQASAPKEVINAVQLDVIGQTSNSDVILKNVFINNTPAGSFEGNGWKSWTITGFNINEGFELRGILELKGDFGSSNENDKVNIMLGHIVNETGEWESSNKTYYIGDKVTYRGDTYECLQTHITNGDMNWAPDIANNLWKLYSNNNIVDIKGYQFEYIRHTNNSNGTSTWYYQVSSDGTPRYDLTYWVLGMNSVHHVVDASNIYSGQIALDNETNTFGMRFNQHLNRNNDTKNVYFTLDKQYETGNVKVAYRASNITRSSTITGPSTSVLSSN